MKCLPLVCLLSFSAGLSPAITETEPPPATQPVLVMQAEVTVDGEERPDLGRSFTDTLTGGLLKTGRFTVIDYLSHQDVVLELGGDLAPRAPEKNACRIGQLTHADMVYVPRLIVEGGFNKMSVKKLRVSDGQVLAVYEADSEGDRSVMFGLAGAVLSEVYSELARDRAQRLSAERRERKETPDVDIEELEPEDESNPRTIVRAPIRLDKPLPGAKPKSKPEVAPAPKAAPKPKVVSKPRPKPVRPPKSEKKVVRNGDTPAAGGDRKPTAKKPDFYSEYAGMVTAVNRDWRFCILNVAKGAKLEVDEEIRVRIDDPLQPVAKLKVVKLEGRQVIADLLPGTEASLLAPGQRAYHWSATPE